jgi:Fe2+ or Zn2+ uptake regulation protein
MKTTFYNTIKLEGKALEEAIKEAQLLDHMVYLALKINSTKLTPYEVVDCMSAIFNRPFLVPSVRRSLTELTDIGLLVMSEKADKIERYGKPNHTWTVAA